MLLLQNLKSFFTKNRLLSVLFVSLLTVSLVGSIFGVNDVLRQVRSYNMELNRQKTFLVYAGEEGIPDLSPIMERYGDRLLRIYAVVGAEDEDGTEFPVWAYGYYTGYLGAEFPASFGRGITAEEMESGARVVLLDSHRYGKERIGESVTLGGIEYTVVGLAGETIVPLGSLPAAEEISVELLDVASASFAEEFGNALRKELPGCRLTVPDTTGAKTLLDFSPQLFPTAVLLVFGAIHLGYIYTYFLEMRKKQYTVFRLCGASVLRIAALGVGEVGLLVAACFGVALLLYKVLAPVLFGSVAFYFADYMSAGWCIGLFAAVLALFLLMFLPRILGLARSVSARNRYAEV